MKTFKENINQKIIEYKLSTNLEKENKLNRQKLIKVGENPDKKVFSQEIEIQMRKMLDEIIKSNIDQIVSLLEDTKNRVTGLIGNSSLEYENLIKFKREALEIYDFEQILNFDFILTKQQKSFLENYKNEFYESAIYGTPLDESKFVYKKLLVGEELYFISKNIKEILNIIN